MAKNLEIGEYIFVPISKLEKKIDSPSAFYKAKIQGLKGRKSIIDVGGGDSEEVANSKCHRNIGITIISIGDFESEEILINPLSKSILQFSRLLASDDYVRHYRLRSISELRLIWEEYHKICSHVIIVGHGNGKEMKFAVDGWVSPSDLKGVFDIDGIDEKCFINLSCELGKAAYGKSFSELGSCGNFIAPFHSVHGAVASQFTQSFLIHNLLDGETHKVAFRHARQRVTGATSFRMWRNGQMITDK